jgi:hypothetical protein
MALTANDSDTEKEAQEMHIRDNSLIKADTICINLWPACFQRYGNF